MFRLYDREGKEVTYEKHGDEIYVWFPGMDLNGEPCIWTGSLDQLIFDEELEVRRT